VTVNRRCPRPARGTRRAGRSGVQQPLVFLVELERPVNAHAHRLGAAVAARPPGGRDMCVSDEAERLALAMKARFGVGVGDKLPDGAAAVGAEEHIARLRCVWERDGRVAQRTQVAAAV